MPAFHFIDQVTRDLFAEFFYIKTFFMVVLFNAYASCHAAVDNSRGSNSSGC